MIGDAVLAIASAAMGGVLSGGGAQVIEDVDYRGERPNMITPVIVLPGRVSVTAWERTQPKP